MKRRKSKVSDAKVEKIISAIRKTNDAQQAVGLVKMTIPTLARAAMTFGAGTVAEDAVLRAIAILTRTFQPEKVMVER